MTTETKEYNQPENVKWIDKPTVGFVSFENFHQKKDTASSRIRVKWVLKHMPEAEEFCQGKDYEAVVYQKAYWKEHIRNFKGKKILDICDPDWMDGLELVGLSKDVDAITVPTEALKEEIEKMTKKPTYLIPDRLDLDTLLPPKTHTEKAKSVVWFGYSHNMEVLDMVTLKLGKMGLKLIVISDGNYNTTDCQIQNIKWAADTANQDIQKADFALLPSFKNGRFKYKSDNKTVLAWGLGLPVAKTVEELERFTDPMERQKEANYRIDIVKTQYDVKKSAEELRRVIESIKK